MKTNKDLAYLHKLCCLPLDKEIILAEFLRAVRRIIPSDNNTYIGLDGQLSPEYFILSFNVTEDLAAFGSSIITQAFTPDCKRMFSQWFSRHLVLTDATIVFDRYYQSDMYNLLCRHVNQHHCLSVPVKQETLPVGMLNLFRGPQDKPFNQHEQAALVSLVPYVEHAIQSVVSEEVRYNTGGMSGVIVMEAHGKIIHLSQEARYLLALMCYPRVDTAAKQHTEAVMHKLAQICRSLDMIFNQLQCPTTPPSWRYKNSHGCFNLHAHWLDSRQTQSDAMIAITIQHQEPMSLVALRTLHRLLLTPSQIEVALYLLQGLTNQQICQTMHIKPSTLKDYLNKLYEKLGISHRLELLPLLQSLYTEHQPSPSEIHLL